MVRLNTGYKPYLNKGSDFAPYAGRSLLRKSQQVPKRSQVNTSEDRNRQAEERYKLLVQLWSSENQVKTAKLQTFALVTSILVSVFVLVAEARAFVSPVGIVFSLVWLFSIGRTLHYQAYWRDQIDKIHEQFSDDFLFEIFDRKSLGVFRRGITGRISSKLILLGTPCVAAICWLGAMLWVIICD